MAAVLGVALLASAPPAQAHTIVELYNPLYLIGSALVVILSFVLISLSIRGGFERHLAGRHDLLTHRWVRGALTSRVLRRALEATSLGGLLLLVLAGLGGSPVEAWNIAPALFWLVLWTVLPAVQALIGNVWSVANPWAVAVAWWTRVRARGSGRRPWPLPASLGVWPAVALWLGLTWFAVVYAGRGDPALLAGLVLVYSALTWSGMWLFGRDAWLAHVEGFTVVFRLLAQMAVLEPRVLGRARCAGGVVYHRPDPGPCLDRDACFAGGERLALNLRLPGTGLFGGRPLGLDEASLILIVLAGGMYRGLVESQTWSSTWLDLGVNLALSPRQMLWNSAGLAAFVLVSVGVYAGTCGLVVAVTGGARPWRAVVLAFAPSLIPVSALFHLAHDLDHTLSGAQRLVRLVSDPFGAGWDLLGTRTWPVADPDLVVVWHLQVVLVVIAHVLAVYVAHVRALALYGEARQAVKSQVPLLVLMIVYTVSGLWILSTIPVVS